VSWVWVIKQVIRGKLCVVNAAYLAHRALARTNYTTDAIYLITSAVNFDISIDYHLMSSLISAARKAHAQRKLIIENISVPYCRIHWCIVLKSLDRTQEGFKLPQNFQKQPSYLSSHCIIFNSKSDLFQATFHFILPKMPDPLQIL